MPLPPGPPRTCSLTATPSATASTASRSSPASTWTRARIASASPWASRPCSSSAASRRGPPPSPTAKSSRPRLEPRDHASVYQKDKFTALLGGHVYTLGQRPLTIAESRLCTLRTYPYSRRRDLLRRLVLLL